MSSPSLTRNNSLMKELEKYVKHLIFKTAQIIIQARQGGKTCTESQPNPKSQSWFSIAINDNAEITHEAKKVVSSAQVSGQGILSVPLCIEISLKTTEGDLLVLENWIISMKDGSDPVARPNTVYNQMGLLLKSILCVSRVLPAYKFARRQGPDTHVMCYRIFAGESSTDPLGSGQQTAQIGQVMTGFSTICVRAEYRTQMTITPCMVNLGCSDPNVSGSSSSQTSAQQASNWVKSDHFISAENLDNAGIVRRNVNNPDYDRFGEGNPVTTSDESSEAMRIFAASPPDNFIHRRFSDHYSSNESLGVQQRFRSRSNTNQSQKSGDHDPNEVKVGAFATKKLSTDTIKSSEADDEFLDLFNLEQDKKEEVHEPNKKPEILTTTKELIQNSPAKRALLFEGGKDKANTKKSDFVMLDTPFSVQGGAVGGTSALDNPQGDLGVFFKEVQGAPEIRVCNEMTDTSLESQLNSLGDQIQVYEHKSDEYDDLLKMLEATAMTSESESEAS